MMAGHVYLIWAVHGILIAKGQEWKYLCGPMANRLGVMLGDAGEGDAIYLQPGSDIPSYNEPVFKSGSE